MFTIDKSYVSFYQLAREMAVEEGLEYPNYIFLSREDKRKQEWENIFRNYRKTKQDYFEEILKNQGINPEIKYKIEGEYRIPVEEKEGIKLLIKEYTSNYYKDFRKGKSLKIEGVEDIVKKAEEVIINSNLAGNDADHQLSSLYGATEYFSKIASTEVYDRVNQMIHKNINNIKAEKENESSKKTLETNRKMASYKSIDDLISNTKYDSTIKIPKSRCLNDTDAALLIYYYEKMLSKATEQWNRLADIYSEIREEEIQYDAFQAIELEGNAEGLDGNNMEYTKSEVLLKEAIKIFNDETIEVPKAKKLTEDQRKNIKNIIDAFNPNKN